MGYSSIEHERNSNFVRLVFSAKSWKEGISSVVHSNDPALLILHKGDGLRVGKAEE